MADVTISPNMGLPVPIVGVEPGPAWANDINSCLGILDQHSHTAGSGVLITPAAININADLALNQNNLTLVKTINFSQQLAPLPGLTPNLGAIYVAGNELYYNDESGNVVQITNTGSVNAGSGSITGLPSGTAGVSYSSGNSTYVFQSATLTPANLDGGSVILRNILPSSFGLTLNPPNAMGADYSVTLPPSNSAGVPVFLTYDTSNNMTVGPAVLGALTTSNLSSSAGILGTQLANNTVTVQQLLPVQSYVWLSGGAGSGWGSTNTVQRYFGTGALISSAGSDITYTSSSVNGDSVTFNTDGIYCVDYIDYRSAGATDTGLTLNASSLTTAIQSVPTGEILSIMSNNRTMSHHITMKFFVGDVVRMTGDGNADGTGVFLRLRVSRII